MVQKVTDLIKKHWDVIGYLIFGVLTTLVNYMIYIPLQSVLGLRAAISNVIAWVGAVAFAFLTNKPFVFGSHDWSKKTVVPELMKFLSCRIGSGVLETGILLLTVDILSMNGVIWKFVTQVLVIVINYIGSKLLVFKAKQK